jgi:hypothetical protein
MLRRIFKIIGWIAGSALGLGVALYLVAVAINWRDREPSAAAIQFANLYRERPKVADEDNAFIYAMGFSVEPGANPLRMGLKRIAWMEQERRAASFEARKEPQQKQFDYKPTRLPAVRTFIDACKPGGTDCANAFTSGDRVFDQWLASEGWLLERYQALIALPGWWESAPFDVRAALPPYGLVVDGQRLLLLNARAMAARGDSVGARKLLEDDLRFWRTVLASSDILISKMIATAAINRHFELGSLIFRELEPGKAMSAVPANWSVEISESERSMRRCLVGEWMYMSAALRDMDVDRYVKDESIFARSLGHLTAPFYQPQDSINRSAEYLSTMAEILSASLNQYEDSVNRAKEFMERTRNEALPPRSAYNIVGQVLEGIGAYDFGQYARRVTDVEGVRRAALVAVTLRAANVDPANVAAALAASSLRDPYTGRAFEWNKKYGTIVFRGLELSERAEHRIRY